MLGKFKVLLIALVILITASSAFAFAAANTVPVSNAGYAASVVSGYTVDDIVYDLDAADPTMVDKITFNINPDTTTLPAAFVSIQTAALGSWTDCTLAAGTPPEMAVTCTFGSLEMANIEALNVVASSSLDPAE